MSDDHLKYRPDTDHSQVGIIGDHARVEGGIHFHTPAAPQSLHQIPNPPPTFRGREEELDELTEAIREGGVTISGMRGMGGIGKTALALKLAHRLAADYPDAQLFIDLNGTSSSPMRPEQAMAHAIHAFQPQLELPTAEGELSGLYRSTLHDKRALLLLDDAADAEQVKPLIPPRCCALLVTSRWRFRLAGMHALDLDVLDEEAALDLLCTIAPRIGNRAAEDIAELCGRLPLALELAASALAERVDLAPAEYARRLRDERRRLDLVDASLSLSYDLLDERLQQLWARLSVFSIPFERKAAAAVWEIGLDSSIDALGELLRYSLIDWKEKVERYDVHALARLFAYQKLQKAEDPRGVHRLAAQYLDVKITDPERGCTPIEALERVDQWEKAQAWERFVGVAHTLVGSLDRLGYWQQIDERLERALEVAKDRFDEPQVEATLMRALGITANKRAEWNRAIGIYERSLGASRRASDVLGIAQTYNNLGLAYAYKGEWDRAIEMYRQSLETFEYLGDGHGAAGTLNNLGSAYAYKGEWDRAIRMYERSLEESKPVDDVLGMAQAYNGLGLVYTDRGEWDRAIEMYEQSLEIKERVGDAHGIANTYNNLGSVYGRKGELDRAIEIYQQGLETFEYLGDGHGAARTLNNLGLAYANQGRWNQAIEVYERSLETSRHLGDMLGMAQAYNNLGLVYSDQGESSRAIEMYELSLEASKDLEDVHGMATTWMNLGLVQAGIGEWRQAIRLYEKSLQAYERLGDVHGVAQTWSNLGSVYVRKGEWDRAIEMYEQGQEIFERIGAMHGMAANWSNIALIYLRTGRTREAKPLLARAYLVFSQLGYADADNAARGLVEACGSVEAANAYLAELQDDFEEWTQIG